MNHIQWDTHDLLYRIKCIQRTICSRNQKICLLNMSKVKIGFLMNIHLLYCSNDNVEVYADIFFLSLNQNISKTNTKFWRQSYREFLRTKYLLKVQYSSDRKGKFYDGWQVFDASLLIFYWIYNISLIWGTYFKVFTKLYAIILHSVHHHLMNNVMTNLTSAKLADQGTVNIPENNIAVLFIWNIYKI